MFELYVLRFFHLASSSNRSEKIICSNILKYKEFTNIIPMLLTKFKIVTIFNVFDIYSFRSFSVTETVMEH